MVNSPMRLVGREEDRGRLVPTTQGSAAGASWGRWPSVGKLQSGVGEDERGKGILQMWGIEEWITLEGMAVAVAVSTKIGEVGRRSTL